MGLGAFCFLDGFRAELVCLALLIFVRRDCWARLFFGLFDPSIAKPRGSGRAWQMADQTYHQAINNGDGPVREQAAFLDNGATSKEAVDKVMLIRNNMEADPRKSPSRLNQSVDECATLLSALGKASPAMMIRLQWLLFHTKLSYAAVAHFQSMHDLAKIRSDADSEKYLSAWHELATNVSKLSDLLASPSAAGCNDDAESLQVLALRSFAYEKLSLELNAANTAGVELLKAGSAKLSCGLKASSESLDHSIPDYSAYAVKTWDQEMVKQELLDRDWDWFVQKWVNLTALHKLSGSLSHPAAGGSFQASYEAPYKGAADSLKAGRTFVAVISTARLVSITLPQSTKGSRLALLESHVEKTKTSNLPANLATYLTREVAKLKKPPSV